MRSIAQWFDLARQRSNLTSDRKLADAIGITQSVVSQMRRGFFHPSPETMIRIADLAKEPRDAALIELQFCKVTSDETRAVWASIAQKIAVGIVVATLGVGFTNSVNAANETRTDCRSGAGLYIMTFCRRWLRRLVGAFPHKLFTPAAVA